MAKEFKVVAPDKGTIVRVYNEPGMSWRDAKKMLRRMYLEMASDVRQMRPREVLDLGRDEAIQEDVVELQ